MTYIINRFPRVPSLQCVASSNSKYEKSSTSNWSDLVTIFAPGDNITVPDNHNLRGYKQVGGTSVAAPLVAAAAANIIGYEGIYNDADLVKDRLFQNAQSGL